MELFFNFLFWLFSKFIFNVLTTVVFLSTVEIQLIFFFYIDFVSSDSKFIYLMVYRLL